MFTEFKVAAVSFRPKQFDLHGNADRLEQEFRACARKGAALALGPEGVLEGYVVNEIVVGNVPARRMGAVAVAIDDPVIRRFQKLARELGMALAFGFAECVKGDVFNAAVFIDQRGRICGKYHKMQLAEGYHAKWWYNRLGRHSRAFDTPLGRCAFMICNDRWNADLARIAALDGAQFLLIPSFGDRSKAQDAAVLARARENGLPIVEANVGRTMIISKGEVVASARSVNALTTGTIAVPALPSTRNRNAQERSFLAWRAKEMPRRRREYVAVLKKRLRKK